MTELVTKKPGEVGLDSTGLLTGTLGKTELEVAAWLIVKYHHERKLDDWSPVLVSDMFDFFRESKAVHEVMLNPFLKPDFRGLVDGGWVTGWIMPFKDHRDAVGEVTEKFIEAVSNPRTGPASKQATRKWS